MGMSLWGSILWQYEAEQPMLAPIEMFTESNQFQTSIFSPLTMHYAHVYIQHSTNLHYQEGSQEQPTETNQIPLLPLPAPTW